jgi:RNA polymerase sigma-70 factor (ECF subfamily)
MVFRRLTGRRASREKPTPPPGEVHATSVSANDEAELLADLRRGDEDAFMTLVERYHPSLVRLAQLYVRDRAVAEEVAQEAWLGVLKGLDNFEGRSSLKTWLFRIVTNIAKTRGQREGRSVAFSTLGDTTAASAEPAVDPDRFHADGLWITPPRDWSEALEERLLRHEARDQIEAAITALPPRQREVITLRDIEGWPSADVCNALGISETNQRVLLHRARSRVRRAVEAYFASA